MSETEGFAEPDGFSALRKALEAGEVPEDAPLPGEPAMDLLEAAWGIIANTGEGDWDSQRPEWREAAVRWRDRYHVMLRAFCEQYRERPRIVCLCGSTRFYDAFQRANYDLTMRGEIVLSVGFYPHARAEHGHGEGVGHDSAEKVALDELHKRKIDLADEVLVVSDEYGYFGQSTWSEIKYARQHGKPVAFVHSSAHARAQDLATGELARGEGATS